MYLRKKKRLYTARSSTQRKSSGYDRLPKSKWKNDFPIILVHGFAGWAPDESPIWGDYWSYVSDPAVSKHSQVYQADVHPFGSLHDRACELYQQIVGILEIRRLHGITGNGPDLARAVYGKSHFEKEHAEFQSFYKPRYMRVVKQEINKIYGFPGGLPGGWSKERKIHLVAHSQGG